MTNLRELAEYWRDGFDWVPTGVAVFAEDIAIRRPNARRR